MDLNTAGQWISAVGGLGAASYGLVDAAKAFWGGPSRVGFSGIRRVVGALLVADEAGGRSLLSKSILLQSLQANWINGVPLEEQRQTAKSFIREQLGGKTAPVIARELCLDPAALAAAATARDAGQPLGPDQQAILAKFDFALSVVIDAAYQRADQAYRNFSKLLATLTGVVLGGIGGYFVSGHPSLGDYLGHADFARSLLVGLLAAPFAPITKDLASVVQAFAKIANPKK